MTASRTTTPGSRRLARLLAMFAIIAGVFLMHGLSGDHDLNSVRAPLAAQAVHGAMSHSMAAPGEHAAGDHGSGGHAGHGVDGCLGLLVAGIGALGAAAVFGFLRRRTGRELSARPDRLLVRTDLTAWPGLLCAPSLTALGLSRT